MAEETNKNRRRASGGISDDGKITHYEQVEVADPNKLWWQFWKESYPYKITRGITYNPNHESDTLITEYPGVSAYSVFNPTLNERYRTNNIDSLNKKFEELYKSAGFEFNWPDWKPVSKQFGGSLNYLNYINNVGRTI